MSLGIARLSAAADAIQQSLANGERFALSQDLQITPPDEARPFVEGVEAFVNATITELHEHDLKALSIVHSTDLQRVVEVCSQLVKSLSSRVATEEQLKRLKDKVLSAKCGGHVPYTVFQDPAYERFRKIIEANHLPNKLLALHMQLDYSHVGQCQEPVLPILVGPIPATPETETLARKDVPWSEIRKETLNSQDGSVSGYRYYSDQGLLFETNAQHKFTKDYTFDYAGILKYDIKGPQIRPFDWRNPNEWGGKNILELWTMLEDSTGRAIQPCLGDHSYFILRRSDGHIYSIGSYAADFTGVDYITPLAHKAQALETPDRYVYLPTQAYHFEKVEIELTAEQTDKVMQRWLRDKGDAELTFSAMNNNCTGWSVHVLEEELGIQLDSKMRVPEFLSRQILPACWQDAVVDFFKSSIGMLPDFIQKAFYFFPLIYVPCLLVLLGGKLFSCGSVNGLTDLPILDILFRPWELYLDHPKILRKSVNEVLGAPLYKDSLAKGSISIPAPIPAAV